MPHPDEQPAVPDVGELERRFQRIRAEHRQIYRPPQALSLAIIQAAYFTQRDLAELFTFSMVGQPSEPQILLQHELLYFFAHLTLRTAVAKGLTEDQIRRVQQFLGPLIAWTAVASFFSHWPDDLKKRITSEFYDKLNDAESEYAQCRGLYSTQDPLSTTTLIGRLAANGAVLMGQPDDTSLKSSIASAAMRAFQGMGLDALVGDVASVIDQVDMSALNMRMKLSARGGHFWWNGTFLIVAAAGCSLCAIR